MRELHCFKKSQQKKLLSPDYKDAVTDKLLLGLLCDLCEWSHSTPWLCSGTDQEDKILHVLYRDFVFTEYDFWETFGGCLIVLRKRWKITAFGTEAFTQEAVELALEEQGGTFYAVQRTVSGKYADTIHSICLQIECTSAGEADELYSLCQIMDWHRGVLAAGWDLRSRLEEERLSSFVQNSCFCYGAVTDSPDPENYLGALTFAQKMVLWSDFLKNGFDYVEFEWLYNQIITRTLDNRIEWELALYTALKRLHYTLKISEAKFELYDGQGQRNYFNFNSCQNAPRAFLKMLFPVNE